MNLYGSRFLVKDLVKYDDGPMKLDYDMKVAINIVHQLGKMCILNLTYFIMEKL